MSVTFGDFKNKALFAFLYLNVNVDERNWQEKKEVILTRNPGTASPVLLGRKKSSIFTYDPLSQGRAHPV